MPFVPNGSDPSAHDGVNSFMSKQSRDIAERGMDSDQWGFVTEALPPLNERGRKNPQANNEQSMPWLPNGWANQYAQAFAQKPDIAERSMDETWVHPFTSDLDVVLPTANPWTRPYLPYNSNGGSNVYAQQEAPVSAPMKKTDIANKEVRPDVYVTVHKLINPVAMGRFREPRPDEVPPTRTWDDGPAPKEAPKPEFKFEKPKEVDEEAVLEKRKAEAAANVAKGKAEKAAKDKAAAEHDPEEKAKGEGSEKAEKPEKKEEKEEKETPKEKEAEEGEGEEKPKKEEKKEEKPKEEKKEEKKEEEKPKEALTQAKKTLAQVATKEDGDKKEEKKEAPAAPEKVHVLEPTVYQDAANTNTPNMRTTFYDKKSQKEDKKAQTKM